MRAKRELAISKKALIVGVVVLVIACLLVGGLRRRGPAGGEAAVPSPTPTTQTGWESHTPAPGTPSTSPSTSSGQSSDAQTLTLKTKVTAEALNVREGPGPDYKIIGQVHRGDVVEILAQNKEESWYKIRSRNLVGWVSATFVEIVSQAVQGSPQAVRQGSPQAVAMAAGTPEPTCLCPCPCTPTPVVVVPTSSPPPASDTPAPVPTGTPTPPSTTEPRPEPSRGACPSDICTPPVQIVTPPATPWVCGPEGCLIPPTPPPPPLLEPEVEIEVICEEVPQPAYGINAALLVEPGIRQRALDRVAELGFNWVKIQIRWLDFEASKGQYTQSLEWLDQAINDAHARNINVMLTVVGAPDWARAPGSDPATTAPPADPQDYADFVAFLAVRYLGKVQAFEIWNEQNLAREWGGRGRMNVGQYMELLRAAHYNLRMANPGVAVVSGGLTPTGTDDGFNAISDRRYLREMYAAGLKDVTNGIGAHASGYNLPPFADWRNPPRDQCVAFEHTCTNPHPSWVFQQTLLDYHDIMVEFGETRKQIWVTEFGWASCEGGFKAQEGYQYCEDNTQWEQAQWLREAYTGVKERGWDWVGILFTWNLNFAELAGPDSEMSAFSILDVNGQPRPAFEALKNMPKW